LKTLKKKPDSYQTPLCEPLWEPIQKTSKFTGKAPNSQTPNPRRNPPEIPINTRRNPVEITRKAIQMNDLLTINEDNQVCNGRALHTRLGVGKDFSTWMKDRISEYGFVEGEDYTLIEDLSSPNLGSSKSRPQVRLEYLISRDMAKELSMLENNEKGREIRRYFINAEKQLKRLHAQDVERLAEKVKKLDLSTYQTELKLEDFSKTRSNLAQEGIEKRARAHEKLIYKVFMKKLGDSVTQLVQAAQSDPGTPLKTHAEAVKAGWVHFEDTDVDTLIAILKP